MNKLFVIGIGPGGKEHITPAAMNALKDADVIVGYNTYISLIKDLISEKEIIQNGMHSEVDRCKKAIDMACEGKKIALVSSGDSGIYGMAGLILEIVHHKNVQNIVDVVIIPGITSVCSCAALLGAPLMHDYASISLSNWLTSWEQIEKRIECAAQGDFVIALYNPKSKKRSTLINEAQKILLKYKSPSTPVGIVKKAYREGQSIDITTLGDMLNHEINMFTTIIIGNATTFTSDNAMITPRGYKV